MNSLDFVRLRKYTQILKDKDVKKIVSEKLDGYKIKEIDKRTGTASFSDSDEDCNIQILFKDENVILVGKKDNGIEITTIKQGPELEEYTYSFRHNGLILEKTDIKYGYSNYSRTNKVPIGLVSKRYVLEGMRAFKLRVANLNDVYKRHIEYIKENSLAAISFFYTTFESFMVNEDIIPNFKGPRDTLYSTHTFVNDRDVSHLYDIVKGPDKLLRVFDLYRGIINERNKGDIKNIHLGLILSDAFGYLELKGIKQREDDLVSKERFNADYIREISNIISEVTWYDDYIESTDRDTLISAIKYVPKASEIAKRNIEKVVGMSYDEFDMLDIEEQEKLIEEKTGKKITYPNDVYVDGYPISKINIDDEIERIVGITKRKIKNTIKKDKNSN